RSGRGVDKEGRAAPYLQGWAVVENTTDEDWKDVRMALVSGRPISFQMNLYDPLFIRRPVVEPELFASLRPVAYSGNLGVQERVRAQTEAESERLALRVGSKKDAEKPSAGPHGPGGGGDNRYGLETRKQLEERLELGGTAAPVAQATKLGDYFQYVIDRPVSLPRQ